MTIKEVSKEYSIPQDILRHYERVGIIPSVTRTLGGTRDYQEEDLRWMQLTICMRSAGFPVEVVTEYVKPYSERDETIPARLQSFSEQREVLLEQRRQIDETIDQSNYKTERYEVAVRTGVLSWDEDNCSTKKM